MKTYIYVKAQFAALHQWKQAPNRVNFLRHPHRHIFYVKAKLETIEDREQEFFLVQEELKSIVYDMLEYNPSYAVPTLNRSCEMTAKQIFMEMQKIGYNIVEVDVSEDDENGAIYGC
jgi:6-pyruvoyl-tetrahydropterin synthase